MGDQSARYVRIVALAIAAALGAWTARACYRARSRGVPGSDAAVWVCIALVYLLMAEMKMARALGFLTGVGHWLRAVAKEYHLYAGRRPFQVAATLAVAAIVLVVLVVGIVSFWDYIKRYRLAVGFTGLAVGFALIRFISLHEVDAWNAQMPWIGTVVDLAAAAGGAAVALARLRQVREFAGLRAPDPIH